MKNESTVVEAAMIETIAMGRGSHSDKKRNIYYDYNHVSQNLATVSLFEKIAAQRSVQTFQSFIF